MKHIYTTLLILISYLSLSAYNYLNVSDPRAWSSGRGKIDSATLTIKPHGAYFEYGLYLTISGGQMAQYYDTTEIVLDFDLPQGAFIEDSWLWVGNDIVRANLIERSTANNIYEGIVQRRQDPSILFKENYTDYKLRIFPLPPGQSRMIKISYLVPVSWKEENITAALPLNILKSSIQTPALTIMFYGDSIYSNPDILGTNANLLFTSTPNYQYKTIITGTVLNNSSALTFSINTPMRNMYYANTFPVSSNQGYYQIAINRSSIFDTIENPESKKVLLLLDYLNLPNDMTPEQVMAQMKSWLYQYFSATDSFNFMYGHNNINKYSNTWLPCTPENISGLSMYTFTPPHMTYSNIPLLLHDGINFIQSNPNPNFSQILLVSNSNSYVNPIIADSLAESIYNQTLPNTIRINTINYTSYNTVGSYGNQQLYSQLASKTHGQYQQLISSGIFYESLSSAAHRIFTSPTYSYQFSLFDTDIDIENGFTYNQYATYNSTDNTDILIGRYYGQPPLKIEQSGIIDGMLVHREFTLNNTSSIDSFTKKMWVANWLNEQESNYLPSAEAQQVIDSSIANRILSRYTAFLALEPSDTIKICAVCLAPNDPVLVNITETNETDISLTAYPNPFDSQVNIVVSLSNASDVTALRLYNLLGQEVYNFDIDEAKGKQLSIKWNGTDANGSDVSPGIYLLSIETAQGRKTLRLIKE